PGPAIRDRPGERGPRPSRARGPGLPAGPGKIGTGADPADRFASKVDPSPRAARRRRTMVFPSTRGSTMRPVLMLLLLGACGGGVQVQTAVSPDANLSRLRTFRIMRAPERNRPATSSLLQPMIESSGANRALRDGIQQALEARGYQPARDDADFAVAYYT